MKFKNNDILVNRNGTEILIINADQSKQEYTYKYLNITDPQFQGLFCHRVSDMEKYWDLATNSKHSLAVSSQIFDDHSAWTVMDEEQSRSRLNRNESKCNHELVNYVGFTEVYKYCKKCDQKF